MTIQASGGIRLSARLKAAMSAGWMDTTPFVFRPERSFASTALASPWLQRYTQPLARSPWILAKWCRRYACSSASPSSASCQGTIA